MWKSPWRHPGGGGSTSGAPGTGSGLGEDKERTWHQVKGTEQSDRPWVHPPLLWTIDIGLPIFLFEVLSIYTSSGFYKNMSTPKTLNMSNDNEI